MVTLAGFAGATPAMRALVTFHECPDQVTIWPSAGCNVQNAQLSAMASS
jgi:hypothetical protein